MIRVLMLLSLILLSSCTEIRYVYRNIYPDIPQYNYSPYPSVELIHWGDYAIYKEQCEAIIMEGNLNLESIYKSLERVEDETK